jgi:IclR family acetate operon transcriptional repressor
MKIASVSKAINILSEVARQPSGPTASEVASSLGMPLSTTYHLLDTLVSESALSKGPDRRYRLGTRINVLSSAYFEQSEPEEQLLGPLHELARQTGETAYLTGWRGGDIEVLASVEGSHALRVANLESGSYLHAHARASGKLLLALASEKRRNLYLARHPLERLTPATLVEVEELSLEFERIREDGYALDREEFTLGIACVAVPLVFDDLVIGSYTVSAPVDRFRKLKDEFRKEALSAAARAVDPSIETNENDGAPEDQNQKTSEA